MGVGAASADDAVMPWLHIEHQITDLPTWRRAYDSFAEVRRSAGVTAEAVRHPEDDPTWIVVDLELATVEQARAFRGFLEAEVWARPERSPALVGTPRATVLVAGEV